MRWISETSIYASYARLIDLGKEHRETEDYVKCTKRYPQLTYRSVIRVQNGAPPLDDTDILICMILVPVIDSKHQRSFLKQAKEQQTTAPSSNITRTFQPGEQNSKPAFLIFLRIKQ